MKLKLLTSLFMAKRTGFIIYAVFITVILFDLVTTILCFQVKGITEANLIYRIVGFWAFPIVYLFDAGVLLTTEWLRKNVKYAPIILLIPIFFYIKAGVSNLLLWGSNGGI